jgi:DNA-directed RNA polymerase subunit N (RpoN/RPB10)
MQDLSEFKEAVAADRKAEKRLQELALQIPKGYGVGADLDAALDKCHDLRGKLALARREAKALGEKYATHVALQNEERQLLSDLGLTANLFRSDSQ